MDPYEILVEHVFAQADIRLDGGRPWDLRVRDRGFFRQVVREGSLGLGEAYMNGSWDCDDLEELSYRFITSGVERRARALPAFVALSAAARLYNRQTRRLSRRVAERHYDFGNDFFFEFLGAHPNYSCGYFQGTSELDEAQRRKMDLICQKLDLRRGDRLLDVGGGWGELSRWAAERYGARVTNVNISDEQIRAARERCRGLDVEFVRSDYRDVRGQFDKIAAIAMFTHVGHRNYRTFMETMHRLLAPGGTLLMEGVWGNTSLTHCEPWTDRYIFPGGMIPSGAQTFAAMEDLFAVEDLHNFGPHYARTLRAWNANLQRGWPSLRARYDERARRMFEYFFLMVAGAFRARDLQNWHLVLTKPPTPQPRIPSREVAPRITAPQWVS